MSVPNTKENMEKCICKNCTTYDSCMSEKNELFFCATGKSECEVNQDECLCETCLIDKEFHLTANLDLMERMILKLNKFYCGNGPAR